MEANDMRAQFILQYEAGRLGNRTFNDREITDFLNKAQLQLVKHRFDALKNRTQRGLNDSVIRQAELWGVMSSSTTVTNDLFMQGTPENGALMGPDKDQVDINNNYNIPHAYGVYVSIPNEALYLLHETITTAKNPVIDLANQATNNPIPVKRNVPSKVMTYPEYNAAIYDPHNRPYSNLVWIFPYGNFTPSTQTVTGGIVSISSSTKDWTYENTGSNIAGITARSYGTENEIPIEFRADRSRYLLPGKDWYVVEYQCHYLVTPPEIFVDVVTPSEQRNCVLQSSIHPEIVDLAVELASAAITPEQNKFQVNQYENEVNE